MSSSLRGCWGLAQVVLADFDSSLVVPEEGWVGEVGFEVDVGHCFVGLVLWEELHSRLQVEAFGHVPEQADVGSVDQESAVAVDSAWAELAVSALNFDDVVVVLDLSLLGPSAVVVEAGEEVQCYV